MILLDTHIWVRWLTKNADPLPTKLVSLIENTDEVCVSAVSCWEIAYLHKRNRIELSVPLNEWLKASLEGSDVTCMPLTREIALKAAMLPEIHRDPIDRFIIAAAIVENMPLISLDERFPEYTELQPFLIL
ncbi:MAG: type II toxin-antitoxin system VapC family toxin [Methylococcales bacterium]|nr:type II toxin-antitoxin system VapC family toxin [Methylococcales bacterium]